MAGVSAEETAEAASSENNSQSSLQKCISLLKAARNDNERFAALLLVTQLVHSNSLDKTARRSLFDAVGFNFLNRLLKSSSVPSGCSQDIYRSLALTILACFATDEELLVHPEMTSKIPVFLGGISDEEENVNISNDCYQILASLGSTATGCIHLSRKEAFSTLCRVSSSSNQANAKKAIEIMFRIINNSPCDVWESQQEGLVAVLKSLSKRFKEAQDSTKFELCNSLVLLLASADKSVFQSYKENQWLEDIYVGVTQILQSRVSSEQRDPAITLVSLVIELIGMDWMLGSPGQESPGLFILSTTVASIETRMILDGKAWTEIVPRSELLISCYNILEKAINFAIVNSATFSSSDGGHQMLGSSLPKVYSLATEAIHSIIQFLENMAHVWDRLAVDERPVQLVYASVRVLCAWMAEETAALQDSICQLLPFLLMLGNESLDTQADCLLEASTNKPDMSRSTSARYVSNVHLNSFITEKSLIKVDIMRFLLPPLCHLSADDKTRKVLIDNGGLLLLSRYFFQQWKIWDAQAKNDGDQQDTETCLVTLLGVLLNFVVTEAELTVNNRAFQEIVQHAIASVPLLLSSGKNVVILVNLVMLGLLFIRSYTESNIALNSEELSKFMKASIYVLKEARSLMHKQEGQCLEQGKTQFAVRCREVWVDVGELWFLGLQVVSALASSSATIREQVKESGWVEDIVTHLNTNSQNQELTPDEKDLLLSLVRKVNDA